MHRMSQHLRAMLCRALVVRTCALILMVPAAVAVAPQASAGADRAPRAPAAGTFVPIEFPGAMFTTAIGINARGQIVGGFRDAGGVIHGFLLDKGVFTQIDVDLPGATRTEPTGINAHGQIVGNFTDADGARRGFLLDGGVFTPINVPGATTTTVFGITDRGQIVGFFINADGVTQGFCSTVGEGQGRRMERPLKARQACPVPDRPTSGLGK
jgi:probable HAF family extracellular repeat protein